MPGFRANGAAGGLNITSPELQGGNTVAYWHYRGIHTQWQRRAILLEHLYGNPLGGRFCVETHHAIPCVNDCRTADAFKADIGVVALEVVPGLARDVSAGQAVIQRDGEFLGSGGGARTVEYSALPGAHGHVNDVAGLLGQATAGYGDAAIQDAGGPALGTAAIVDVKGVDLQSVEVMTTRTNWTGLDQEDADARDRPRPSGITAFNADGKGAIADAAPVTDPTIAIDYGAYSPEYWCCTPTHPGPCQRPPVHCRPSRSRHFPAR